MGKVKEMYLSVIESVATVAKVKPGELLDAFMETEADPMNVIDIYDNLTDYFNVELSYDEIINAIDTGYNSAIN